MLRKCSSPNDSKKPLAPYANSLPNSARIDRSPASSLVAICNLERELAEAFRPRKKFSDSRVLLMDSLELLEAQRRVNEEPDLDAAYARTLLELGWSDIEQGHFDDALVWVERAERGARSAGTRPALLESQHHDRQRATNDRGTARSSRLGRTAAEASGGAHSHA